MTQGSLNWQNRDGSKAQKLVTIEGFAITKSRKTAKGAKKKLLKASAQAGASNLMTLDFFEGSGVQAAQGEDSPHTSQLKNFVFIQQ